MDVDEFGSPLSYQIFPSILRMLCAKMCALVTEIFQNPPRNRNNHPRGNNSKAQNFPSFLRSSTNIPPPQFWPSENKTLKLFP